MMFSARTALLLCFAVSAAPAFAADMALRGGYVAAAEPGEAARYEWSGGTLGVQGAWAGGASGALDLASTATQLPSQRDLGSLALRGGSVGLRAGYDIQSPFSPWVAGVGAEINADGLRRTVDVATAQGVAARATARAFWDAALRLRVGYAQDRWLIYATLGAALAREKLRLSAANAAARADILASKPFLGATLGLGVEYALAKHLTAGLDYRYVWFGDKTLAGGVFAGAAPAGVAQAKIAPDMHRLAATLNCRY